MYVLYGYREQRGSIGNRWEQFQLSDRLIGRQIVKPTLVENILKTFLSIFYTQIGDHSFQLESNSPEQPVDRNTDPSRV